MLASLFIALLCALIVLLLWSLREYHAESRQVIHVRHSTLDHVARCNARNARSI